MPPNLCTSVQSVGVFVGGYGIPAIPTPPSANSPTEFAEPTENDWRKIFSHRFHRCSQIRRVWHPAIPTLPSANPPTEFTEFTEASGRGYSPTDFTDAHRNFWRRRASHRFHRCPQMVRLRRVLWLLWEDSLVAAWVWQGCHTLLICENLCNLWELSLIHI